MRPSPFASLAMLVAALAASHRFQAGPAARSAPQQDLNWLTSASAEMARAEYLFSPVRDEPGVWSAPNRAHELRSRISPQGLEVFPRATSADGRGALWKLHLRTARFGRTDGSFELSLPTVTVTGERVELEYDYATEWFENNAQGIEQAWTIRARPLGTGDLWIGLEIAGDLSFRIENGARSGVFVNACGEVILRYRDLLVFDATSRELPTRLESRPEGTGIRIDDAGASYPLTIDPVLTGPSWTTEGNQDGAEHGTSVATAGDVNGDGYSDVVIGAHAYDNGQLNEGRAYLYLGSAIGLSTSPAWTAESDQATAQFGVSVATAGDVNRDGYSDVIVGANTLSNGQANEGRAYLYLGTATGLSAVTAWTAESNQDTALFGNSVATAGDVNGDGYSDLIVGAVWYDNGQTDEGRAVLYLGSASGPSTSPDWTAESDQLGASFGCSVATGGDVNGDGYSDVIIGAYGYDNGQTDEGRAFLYLGSATGLSTSPAWVADGVHPDAYFGTSVATAGDVNGDGFSDAIVGAFYCGSCPSGTGRALVYMGSATGLSPNASWTAGSDQTDAYFGLSVATAGDVNGDGYSDVVVGAPTYDTDQTDEGRAYLYLGSALGLWTSPASTVHSDQAMAWLGYSVAMAGDVNGDGYGDVIVSARYYSNDQAGEGGAFLYNGSATGLSLDSAWASESNSWGALFGSSVSGAGDVNGDGFSDILVGAPRYDNGQVDEGRAYLYLGSSTGVAQSPAWTAESNQDHGGFGESLSTAGDVNGDGYSDVIIGAAGYDNGEANEGRAYVYLGSSTGVAQSPDWTAESDQPHALFGYTVSSAGDVNGDGYSDVIVGAVFQDNDQLDQGRAYVYHGSPEGLADTSAWIGEGEQLEGYFGVSVSDAGDVNRDGYADVIVGELYYDALESNEGRAYLYLGSSTGLSVRSAWTAEGGQINANFGRSVSSAGDVNGDGYSDVIVGAIYYDNGENNEGRAFVYLGSPRGLSLSPAWTSESDQESSFFAFSVSDAGDVNGDGYSDVVIGAWAYDNGENEEGRASVYLGSANGLAPSPAWTVDGDQPDATFGFSVSKAGDVDGDGYSDVIVGAPGYDSGQTDEGRAYVYLGNEGAGGLVRKLQQRTVTGNRPLAVVGAVGRDGLFRIRCEFPRIAAQFGWASPAAPKAWVEWEVKPLGKAFDGFDVHAGTPQLLGLGGGTLTFDELATIPNTITGRARVAPQSYHWRARVSTNNPLFAQTAWFSVQGSNVTEAKLRRPWR